MAISTKSLAKELGISEYRVFNGKRYQLASTPRSKREAKESTKTSALLGRLARIVPVKGGKYVLYERNK